MESPRSWSAGPYAPGAAGASEGLHGLPP